MTVGIASFGHAPNFLSSKVQVGVTTGAGVFRNFMASLGSIQSGTSAYPSVLDVNGYPQGTTPANIFGTIKLPSNLTSSDVLSLSWTGTISAGAVTISRGSPGFTVSAGASFVNGTTGLNIAFQGTNGYVEFAANGTPAGTNLTFNLNGTFTSFGNLIFCRKTDYNAIVNAVNPQDLITAEFISALKALNPATIRTMPWGDPNDDNMFTQFRYRKDWKNNLGYAFPTWIPNCWAGGPGTAGPNITSGGVGNAFVCSAATDTPVAYTEGEVIQGQMDAAGSGTGLTINVGGRGAVPLFNTFGSALLASSVSANSLATLIYDAVLGGYIYKNADARTWIPIETQIGLANAVGCKLWYNIPPHTTTKSSALEATSSVSQIATVLAGTANASPYIEYANEIWNTGGSGFAASSWASSCGVLFGFPSANNEHYHGFYGYKICTIQPQITTAFGVKPFKMVNAFQAFGAVAGTNKYRLQGFDLASVANGGLGNALWISYTGNANFTAFPNRPVDLCDTLAYATYYSGAQCTNFDANYAPSSPGNKKTVTAVSQANPGVLSYASDPGYATGDRVQLAGTGFSGGMTQLNNVAVSLTRLTATTYSIYSDAGLTTPIDTTAFTAYTSAGTSGRYPQISGLTAWADLYATGIPANQASALASLDNDIRQGTSNGTTGSQTLLSFLSVANSGVGIYPGWETVAAGYDGAGRPSGKSNLTVECYEGAMESAAPSTTSCTTLGISTSYGGFGGSIDNLITAYKNSSLFNATVQQQFTDFFGSAHSKTGCWFLVNGGGQWSLYVGDIYSAQWQSYGAVQSFH